MTKPKLKWYGPLNRWMTEDEHKAHVSVEPELENVYKAIVADAIPVTSPEPPTWAATAALQQLGALQNVYGQYNALQAQGMANCQTSQLYGYGALNSLFGRLV